MPTPGFPVGTLSESGFPAWIDALHGDDTHFMIHVVRGLEPAGALEAIGARAALFMTCVLPGGEAVPPQQVFGQPGCEAVLLAGQAGARTFVYDGLGDTGYTEDPHRRYSFVSMAEILSASGREAASSSFTINAGTSLSYAVDGHLLLDIGQEVDPGEDDIPAGLRAAVEAAGTFGPVDDEGDGPDFAVNIRVVCALAGLNLTPGACARSRSSARRWAEQPPQVTRLDSD